MTELPVSVVIAAYERAAELPRALASVAAQARMRPAEVLVVDDASRDATAAVAEAAGARVLCHAENRGPAAARNTALAAAAQPWVAFLDTDDEWLPHHLEHVWGLRSAGTVLAAGSAVRRSPGAPGYLYGSIGSAPEPVDAGMLVRDNPIPFSASLADRAAVLAAGGFDPALRYAEDLDLWLRLLAHGGGVLSPTVTCVYNEHAGQAMADQAAGRRGVEAVLAKYAGSGWWSARDVEHWRATGAWDALRAALRSGDRGAAARAGARLLTPRRAVAVGRLLAGRRRLRARGRTAGA